jgi:transposase InsO family protein
MRSPRRSTDSTKPRSSGDEGRGNFERVESATLQLVDWFNNKRLLEPIGNIPPAEAEARYYAQIEEPALAA